MDNPVTVFGYLAAAIVQRMDRRAGGVTIISCDNVREGGALLRDGTYPLLREHARRAVSWAQDHVSFASSVVDRVTPVTTERLVHRVKSDTGIGDAWPVATEPFRQWVIEDKFAGERPPLDSVGASFTADIAVYQRMKLACLNAGHSIIAAIGYLLEEEHVHSALECDAVERFVRMALTTEVLPLVDLPPDVNGHEYIDLILQRFKNASLPYRISQVCSDSTQKIQQRWFPSIDRLIQFRRRPRYFPVALAAWTVYVERAVKDGTLVDPGSDDLIGAVRRAGGASAIVSEALRIAGAMSYAFWSDLRLRASVEAAYADIRRNGIRAAIGHHRQNSRAGGDMYA